jgi:hypothetical protein
MTMLATHDKLSYLVEVDCRPQYYKRNNDRTKHRNSALYLQFLRFEYQSRLRYTEEFSGFA